MPFGLRAWHIAAPFVVLISASVICLEVLVKRLTLACLLVLFIGASYIASPFVTAFRIREAVKSGDTAYLETKFEWDQVRATLAPSLGRLALGPGASADPSEAAQATLWQRVKARMGRRSVERAVDAFVSAEGLPKLFTYRQTYREMSGTSDEPRTLGDLPQRIAKAWGRMKRAEFTSLSRIEIDMADKHTPDRLYLGVLEFNDWEWKVTGLRVRSASDPAAYAALPPPSDD